MPYNSVVIINNYGVKKNSAGWSAKQLQGDSHSQPDPSNPAGDGILGLKRSVKVILLIPNIPLKCVIKKPV